MSPWQASQHSAASHHDPVAAHRAELLSAQRLRPEDLFALHRGEISEAVRDRIASGAAMTRAWAWFATAATPLSLLVAGLVGTLDATHAVVSFGELGLGWPLIFAPLTALAAVHLHRQARAIAGERDAEVQIVEGVLEKGMTGETSKSRRPFLVLGNDRFDANDQPFVRALDLSLVSGRAYRGYVTATRRMLFLVEPLPAPSARLRALV